MDKKTKKKFAKLMKAAAQSACDYNVTINITIPTKLGDCYIEVRPSEFVDEPVNIELFHNQSVIPMGDNIQPTRSATAAVMAGADALPEIKAENIAVEKVWPFVPVSDVSKGVTLIFHGSNECLVTDARYVVQQDNKRSGLYICCLGPEPHSDQDVATEHYLVGDRENINGVDVYVGFTLSDEGPA